MNHWDQMIEDIRKKNQMYADALAVWFAAVDQMPVKGEPHEGGKRTEDADDQPAQLPTTD